jgi:novobiocin biosynthesis protein NovU/D-mycarose 3-C-methyltransferase
MKITNSPISGESDGVEFLNLGNIPLVNNLCSTKEESLSCEKFPLAVQFFPNSKVTCLTETVEKDNLFLHYLYQSGVNKPYLKHCGEMYDYLSHIIDFKDNDLILDVGGNDGSLLKEFRKENRNLYYVNVDCSRSFIDVNRDAGIEYINEYFGSDTVLPYKAKLITSTNVFQHTEPMRSFVQGIRRNLSNEGIWCLEFPYILTTLANDNYDQVYHEHVYYFCLHNIVDIAKQEGLKVINVSYHDMHAGTLRVLIAKASSRRQPDSTILSFLNLEKTLTTEYCLKWGTQTKKKIRDYEIDVKRLAFTKGASIACFGAAAKGCVFLNTCGIDHTMIQFIVDDTTFKQGKFVPGTGIEVVSREKLKNTKIDYIIILAHNFKDYIIDSLKGQYTGKFITMFPDMKII